MFETGPILNAMRRMNIPFWSKNRFVLAVVTIVCPLIRALDLEIVVLSCHYVLCNVIFYVMRVHLPSFHSFWCESLSCKKLLSRNPTGEGKRMKKIVIASKKDLLTYMNPVRQELLRLLMVNHEPMTAKMLADRLQISASGVQHHLEKLKALELVELDHTEIIHGITARFYKATPVTVQIGLDRDKALASQKQVLLQQAIARTYDRFWVQLQNITGESAAGNATQEQESLGQWGDILCGVMHLDSKESRELLDIIRAYIEMHASPAKDKSAWEYALVLYNTEKGTGFA